MDQYRNKLCCALGVVFAWYEYRNSEVLQSSLGLLRHKDSGNGVLTTHNAKGSMKSVLNKQSEQMSPKKRKLHTVFVVTDKAEIGQVTPKHEYRLLTKEKSQIT